MKKITTALRLKSLCHNYKRIKFRGNFPLFLLIFFFSLFSSYGQECGTPTNVPNQDFKLVYRDIPPPPNMGPYCINVKFHIVRENNGSGGFNPAYIPDIVYNLNQAYNPHSIFINDLGYDFIDNSTYYNLIQSEFNGLISINNNPNAINFYLVNNYGNIAGQAQSILSKNLVVANLYALTSTSEHEFGHCLNLYHTHHGTWLCERDSTTCVEVDGVNNSTCGDYVADTPADPCLFPFTNNGCSGARDYVVDGGCNYTGNPTYNPDTNNIMSYSRKYCRVHFTYLQGQRMRDALLGSSVLQQVVNGNNACSFVELEGDDTICYGSGKVFSILNASGPYAWTSSSNLTLVPPTNSNSVIAQVSNPNTRDKGYVRVTYNGGKSLTKYLWLGKPRANAYLTPDPSLPNKFVYVNLDYNNYSVTKQNITNAVWQKIGGNGNLHVQDYFNGFGSGAGNTWYIDVRVTLTNPCGNTIIDFTITPPPPLLEKVVPVPNESNEQFSLDFSQLDADTFSIILYDSYGNVKYTGQSDNNLKIVDTSNLNEGVYFIHMSDSKGNTTIKKLIINH